MYFQKPFSFEGRISRGEYILTLIIAFLIYFIVNLLIENYFDQLLLSNI